MFCDCLVLRTSILLRWAETFRAAENFKMSKAFTFLFLLLTSGHFLYGQDKLDSLTARLSTEKDDSLRFEILLKLSRESEYFDYAKARRYAEEASDIAGEIGETWANAKLSARLAFLEKIEGDY